MENDISKNTFSLEDILIVGNKIKIGKNYAKECGFKEGEIIELVQGSFEEDNGLYCFTSHAPAIWNEHLKEFDSIYHLFGNKLENFMDCEVLPFTITLKNEL